MPAASRFNHPDSVKLRVRACRCIPKESLKTVCWKKQLVFGNVQGPPRSRVGRIGRDLHLKSAVREVIKLNLHRAAIVLSRYAPIFFPVQWVSARKILDDVGISIHASKLLGPTPSGQWH